MCFMFSSQSNRKSQNHFSSLQCILLYASHFSREEHYKMKDSRKKKKYYLEIPQFKAVIS